MIVCCIPYGAILLSVLYGGYVYGIMDIMTPCRDETCYSEGVNNLTIYWATDFFLSVIMMLLSMHLLCFRRRNGALFFRGSFTFLSLAVGHAFRGIAHREFPNNGLGDGTGMKEYYIFITMSYFFFTNAIADVSHFARNCYNDQQRSLRRLRSVPAGDNQDKQDSQDVTEEAATDENSEENNRETNETDAIVSDSTPSSKSSSASVESTKICGRLQILFYHSLVSVAFLSILSGSVWCVTGKDQQDKLVDGRIDQYAEVDSTSEEFEEPMCVQMVFFGEVAWWVFYALFWMGSASLLGTVAMNIHDYDNNRDGFIWTWGLPSSLAAAGIIIFQITIGVVYILLLAFARFFLEHQDAIALATIVGHYGVLMTAFFGHNLLATVVAAPPTRQKALAKAFGREDEENATGSNEAADKAEANDLELGLSQPIVSTPTDAFVDSNDRGFEDDASLSAQQMNYVDVQSQCGEQVTGYFCALPFMNRMPSDKSANSNGSSDTMTTSNLSYDKQDDKSSTAVTRATSAPNTQQSQESSGVLQNLFCWGNIDSKSLQVGNQMPPLEEASETDQNSQPPSPIAEKVDAFLTWAKTMVEGSVLQSQVQAQMEARGPPNCLPTAEIETQETFATAALENIPTESKVAESKDVIDTPDTDEKHTQAKSEVVEAEKDAKEERAKKEETAKNKEVPTSSPGSEESETKAAPRFVMVDETPASAEEEKAPMKEEEIEEIKNLASDLTSLATPSFSAEPMEENDSDDSSGSDSSGSDSSGSDSSGSDSSGSDSSDDDETEYTVSTNDDTKSGPVSVDKYVSNTLSTIMSSPSSASTVYEDAKTEESDDTYASVVERTKSIASLTPSPSEAEPSQSNRSTVSMEDDEPTLTPLEPGTTFMSSSGQSAPATPSTPRTIQESVESLGCAATPQIYWERIQQSAAKAFRENTACVGGKVEDNVEESIGGDDNSMSSVAQKDSSERTATSSSSASTSAANTPIITWNRNTLPTPADIAMNRPDPPTSSSSSSSPPRNVSSGSLYPNSPLLNPHQAWEKLSSLLSGPTTVTEPQDNGNEDTSDDSGAVVVEPDFAVHKRSIQVSDHSRDTVSTDADADDDNDSPEMNVHSKNDKNAATKKKHPHHHHHHHHHQRRQSRTNPSSPRNHHHHHPSPPHYSPESRNPSYVVSTKDNNSPLRNSRTSIPSSP